MHRTKGQIGVPMMMQKDEKSGGDNSTLAKKGEMKGLGTATQTEMEDAPLSPSWIPSSHQPQPMANNEPSPQKPASTIHTKRKHRAASPIRKTFDPYNSSATGHQRADNRLGASTSWRASRSLKLSHQFVAGMHGGGGERMYDTVGAGSLGFGKDGRKENGGWDTSQVAGARGEKGLGSEWGDLGEWVRGGKCKGMKVAKKEDMEDVTGRLRGRTEGATSSGPHNRTPTSGHFSDKSPSRKKGDGRAATEPERKIFQGLTVYVNGSTAPFISDHKLKYLLTEHGANISIVLGRRSVTHVLLGTPNAGSGEGRGAGGGLAAGKIEKEIRRVGGVGVKFVGVEWALESIRAGIRLPEARFSNLSTAPTGVQSVYHMLQPKVQVPTAGNNASQCEKHQRATT